MKIRNLMFAAAAGSLVSAPVALQAADTASIDRSSMPTNAESELGGGIGIGFVIAALAGAGMLALILTEDDEEDEAVSP